MNDEFFDTDPELSEHRAALFAAWELIGYIDMGLEQIQSPHMSAKAKREMLARLRAKIKSSIPPPPPPPPPRCPHCGAAHDLAGRVSGDRVYCVAGDAWYEVRFTDGGGAVLRACDAPAAWPRETRRR